MDNKIVNKGIKIDLHIHSAASAHKDGDKVINGNINNTDLLLQKLSDNDIKMAAITDHDAFDFEIYNKLRLDGKDKDIKFLPGVEFTIDFDSTKVHVVTIFNDSNLEKVKKISTVLDKDKYSSFYKEKQHFSEKVFEEIMNDINLDAILIAHQKGDPNFSANKNDIKGIDKEEIKNLFSVGFIDALEFRNWKRENSVKEFIKSNSINSNSPVYVSGSDCHNWSFYPDSEPDSKAVEYYPIFMKSLPTFKGLKMAVTDKNFSRFSKYDDFFNNNSDYIEKINYKIGDTDHHLPLSKGINVIIGGNSNGKSYILNKLSGSNTVDYKNFEMKTEFSVQNVNDSQIRYDSQGKIRDLFASEESIFSYFNKTVKKNNFIDKVENYFELKNDLLVSFFNNVKRYKSKSDINFKLEIHEPSKNKLNIIYSELKNDSFFTDEQENIDKNIQAIIKSLEISNLNFKDEIKQLNEINLNIANKLKLEEYRILQVNNLKMCINESVSAHINSKYEHLTGVQALKQKYNQNKNEFINLVADKLKLYNNSLNDLERFKDNEYFEENKDIVSILKPFKNIARVESKDLGDDNILNLNSYYIMINSFIKSDAQFKIENLNSKININSFLNYFKHSTKNNFDTYLKKKTSDYIGKNYKIDNFIKSETENTTDKNSQGLNSRNYFGLLKYQMDEPIYFVDQPEDDVSQKSIKNYVLPIFKEIALEKQIIIVTHNPQFIVNLDVDNVIFIDKSDDNKITIKSGALEYENNNTNILNIIADNIDGGTESILMRWNRYKGGHNFENEKI